MGGWGSGRWGWHSKRQTVEGCYEIHVGSGGRFLGKMPPGTWRAELERGPEGMTALRLMGYKDGWTIEERIALEKWSPRFGGEAYWFLCPRCGRKSRRLFAPPSTAQFRCRVCWRLAYESSQAAHAWDRGTTAAMMMPFARTAGVSLRDIEKLMRADRKSR